MHKHPLTAHNEITDATYKRSLQKIRATLPLHVRILSSVVHSPPLELLGSIIERTIRPSFLIGSGLSATGAAVALHTVVTAHGHTFNYAAVALAFVVGGLAGVVVELAIRLRNILT